LKIAVNTRLLLKNRLEGIGWFIYETMKRITQSHPEHQFYFIFDRKYNDEFVFSDNVTPIVLSPQARHPVLHYLWFEHSIPNLLKKLKPDLFVSPDAYCSLRTHFKTLLVIHDLNFEHYPEHMPWLVRKYYRYYTPKFAGRANRIATVSGFSKRDIVQQYQIDPEKIDVVYNGVNPRFQPISENEKSTVKNEISNGKDYFIFIGALNPRKNLVNLFKAFDIFKKKHNLDHQLLIVGEKMWWSQEIKNTFEQMEFKNEVRFAGRLGLDKLTPLVAAAEALTFVSWFEGFGIPILEAFQSGTPVITSNVTSMPEVAGEAALLVDPFKPDDIANAMKKVVTDNALKQELIIKGIKRAKDFSWDQTAQKLWLSMMTTIDS